MKNIKKTIQIIDARVGSSRTEVESFWGGYTVCSSPFSNAEESLNHLKKRSIEHPFLDDFLGLYGEHNAEVIVDYGCGPGNDVVGFLAHSKAKKVIGIDVSSKALELARQRLMLHEFPHEKIELILTSDSDAKIPLPNSSVDYIYSEGVLHHTSHPLEILMEFNRILKPGSKADIMVYNRNSIWFHVFVAYKLMLWDGWGGKYSLDESFCRSTDSGNCPISRAYKPGDFSVLCEQAGFWAEYKGGYFYQFELDIFYEFIQRALSDKRLPTEHLDFIYELSYDDHGFPMYQGKHAGVHGVFSLNKNTGNTDYADK